MNVMGKASARALLVLAVLVLVNLVGTLIGFIYYYGQLSATSPLLWIFVPDCPLYTGLFALLIILAVVGIRNDLFGLIVSIGLMKYGAWTLFALSFYHDFFFSFATLVWVQSAVLFILHIGMTAEGFVLPFRRIRGEYIAAALGWFLLNDFFDYFGPTVHPYLPSMDLFPAMAFAIISTLVFTALAAWLWEKRKRIRISGLS